MPDGRRRRSTGHGGDSPVGLRAVVASTGSSSDTGPPPSPVPWSASTPTTSRPAGRPDLPRRLSGRLPAAAGAVHRARHRPGGPPSLQDDIINSALRQFPVIGSDLKDNVRQLSTGNALALAVGLLWLAYGSMRLSRSVQVMMAAVWGIRRTSSRLLALDPAGGGVPRRAGRRLHRRWGTGRARGLRAVGRLFGLGRPVAVPGRQRPHVLGRVRHHRPDPEAPSGGLAGRASSGAPDGRCCSSSGRCWSTTSSATSPTSTGPSPPCSGSSGGSPSAPCSRSMPPNAMWC